ncbi:MAG: fucose isomerase, partial [Planctomycetes bacterium]|nr:fucose isomerase [Planctomycetota bacterium]
MDPKKRITLGLIVGNRGFFPDHLVDEGRTLMLSILAKAGIDVVALDPKETKFGAVESREDAEKCAALFRRECDRIDGVLVTLPNFGDERAIADTLKLANLRVPVLIQATPDEIGRMTIENRRDSFCGKMSACNNLRQYKIDFSLTRLHTVAPDSPDFADDLTRFAGICRVVRGLRQARIGAIGARPAAFHTVRFSEKLLQDAGITVETVDLSDIFGRAWKLGDGAPEVKAKLEAIQGYVPCAGVPQEALIRSAKLAVVIEAWIRENGISATAVQCWTSIEEHYGIVPCTVMSMLSEAMIPSACEVDVCGAIGMYAMALASGRPSALLDWNNNYGDDPDRCVVFHCSNLPKSVFEKVRMDYQDIIAGTVGKENTYGTCVGRIKPGPFTFARVSTWDSLGLVRTYVGEGEFT